ncbi:AlpA family transcriptional regulator [Marinobacterium sp. xm-d-564]|uniref:helix-turn-helix transcriptional regulator n=1 Tax=Marinobacterium sp. xm-d-564 TaxID=2497742 RepID=UPI001569F8AE|nr:AlpA family transcriptional regulator [Marinobacterium sp. xm-d-564]NRP60256.1 Prophage CP4-57 regulatory protein (AlpA) [Marinobacterium sp. xm-d-564]
MNVRLIRLSEVKHLTGLSRSKIYADMSEGTFPKSIKLGERSVAWNLADIEEWIHSKIDFESSQQSAEQGEK